MSANITSADLLKGLNMSQNLLLDNQSILNELNYFPVADKDTGTNMAISFQKSCSEIFRVSEYTTPREIMDKLVNGMLLYGHGNSGTILTMFFDGFLSELPDTPSLNGVDIAKAFFVGARAASDAVVSPMDGTILSVSRDAADAALSIAEITDDAGVIWKRITTEAHASLAQTAFKNPVLKDKVVCDSGAYGFCLLLDGMFLAICEGEPLPPYDTRFFKPANLDENNTPEIELEFRYCTEFVLKLDDPSTAQALEGRISCMGDCFLMITKGDNVKVHIHTNDPELVMTIANEFGSMTSGKIDDMTQ